ncbi:hypothetical protein EGW08_002728 [Elysia chlorotica]|uniref:Uncharacterized protein n=1 Tax=Elysia chlorotica TaxID=188477 RepID=A0A433U6P3_ELYCH|nr:hypothetical protein EGW08_002728 [Elysia chlorotica]
MSNLNGAHKRLTALDRRLSRDSELKGSDNEVELSEMMKESSDLMIRGSVPLTKWISNSGKVREDLERSFDYHQDIQSQKLLGLAWNPTASMEDGFGMGYHSALRESKFDFAVCLDCEKRKSQIVSLEADIAKTDLETPDKSTIIFFQDGKISESVRLAALELIALDVATGKVCDVIEVVVKHIFQAQYGKKPSRQAIQNIVDAGQYIAKTFINKEIAETDSLGIAKGQDSRNKRPTQQWQTLQSWFFFFAL